MSSTRYYPYALDNTAGRQTVSDLSNDHIQFGVGISSDFQITGVTTFTGSLTLTSSLIDVKGQVGSAGSILASTGSGIDWISPSTTSVDNATKVGTNLDSTNASQWIAFLGASSGNNPIRVDNDLRYNPSTNVLSVKGITLPADDQKITLGDSGDLEIFCTPSTGSNGGSVFKHTGDHDMRFQVPSGAHDIVFEDTSGNNIAVYNANAGCELHWRGASGAGRKFQTTQTGVNVTGELETDTINVTGNVQLGDATSDTITCTAHVNSDIVPSGTTRDLGGASAKWRNIFLSGNADCEDIHIRGELKDKDGGTGTSGQVLSSTGTQVDWVNVGSLAAGSASQVAITDDNDDNSERFILFCDSATGNNSIKSDATLKFNPSTNALTAGSFIRNGGSSSQFLKADGSVDSNTYLTTESDTTYDLSAVDSSNDIILRLDPSSGSNDDIKIVAGSNVTLTHDSATQFTITTQNDNTTDPTNLGNTATGSSFTITSSTGSNTNLPAATTSAWGMMTDEDKTKLNAIESGATSDQTSTDIKSLLASDKLTNTHIAILNQNTTGTAAALTTTITIGGVSFNGSTNIDLPGVNIAGNQNTSGTAANLSGSPNFTFGNINGTKVTTSTLEVGDIKRGVNNADVNITQEGSGQFTVHRTTESRHTNPETDSTYDLGTSSKRWRTVYADNFDGGFDGMSSGANMTVFTSNGTFTPQSNSTAFLVYCTGGGGGTARAKGGGAASGGGGGGGTAIRMYNTSQMGSSASVTAGSGGSTPGNNSTGSGGTGGTSTFDPGGSGGTLTGNGGGGTTYANGYDGTLGGTGGSASGGQVNCEGLDGFIGRRGGWAPDPGRGMGGKSFWGAGNSTIGGGGNGAWSTCSGCASQPGQVGGTGGIVVYEW